MTITSEHVLKLADLHVRQGEQALLPARRSGVEGAADRRSNAAAARDSALQTQCLLDLVGEEGDALRQCALSLLRNTAAWRKG